MADCLSFLFFHLFAGRFALLALSSEGRRHRFGLYGVVSHLNRTFNNQTYIGFALAL